MKLRFGAKDDRRDAWRSVRDSLDLAEIIARCLGPAPGRTGSRGDRRWWCCPFHPDRNPSLSVRPGERRWRCFGCGAKGDAVDFARRLYPGMSFPEIVSFLTGRLPAQPMRPAAVARPERPKGERPEGWQQAIGALVVEAERALWSPGGAEALRYLRGRGLADATIRAARLGFLTGDRDRRIPRGVAIPWGETGAFRMVNVRRPDGSIPKYLGIEGSRREGLYPGPSAIRPGHPVVIVEGELDALLLGQELSGLASVVTLGSAGMKPDAPSLGALLPGSPWIVATDNDPAGEIAAGSWPASARRVRPPGRYKDWTDARQDGVNLRRWWGDVLAGNPDPPLFAWEELARLRWGEADDSPGIDSSARRPSGGPLSVYPESDPYACAERDAFQAEDSP